MRVLDQLDALARKWLIRLIVFEVSVFVIVHTACSYCWYDFAGLLAFGSILPIIAVATHPAILGPITLADAARVLTGKLFERNNAEKGSYLYQYYSIITLAVSFHCAILMRIFISPLTSGITENFSATLIASFGFYMITKMHQDGFGKWAKQFINISILMGFIFSAASLFPIDTKIGFTFKYMMNRSCSCGVSLAKFDGFRDINPACMFNADNGRARLIVGQYSKTFDPLYRTPFECRPVGVPHEGFDYQRRSTCFLYGGYGAANGPERLVPFTSDDAIAMNYYLMFQRWRNGISGTKAGP